MLMLFAKIIKISSCFAKIHLAKVSAFLDRIVSHARMPDV